MSVFTASAAAPLFTPFPDFAGEADAACPTLALTRFLTRVMHAMGIFRVQFVFLCTDIMHANAPHHVLTSSRIAGVLRCAPLHRLQSP